MLKLAIRENPGAQIIYKAHPDLEFSDEVRKIRSEVSGDYQIIDGSISMYDCTEEVDQAYTITSLSGFEALLAGVPKVTTLGCPFYAGWGLTDDRQYNPRRTVKRTLEEVFACAYLLYPTYFDPASGKKLKAEEVADRIYKEKVKAYGKERQLYAPFPKLKEVKLPSCFDRRNSKEIQRVVDSDKKIILAISDGRAGDDIIFNKFSESVNIPLELLNIVTDDVAFEKAFIFAKQNPLLYKRYITNRLTPLISNIKMVLFTSDLNPFTRIVVEVCAELEIKTLLIVNEPRYISHETWYWDPESRVSIPQCEEVWVSTSFQKDIFIERGYPEDRIFVTPSPYIMSRVDYSIKISKKQFCRLYGFDPLKKIVLYSCVDFGLFVDSSLANRAQKDSLLAVINYCRDNDVQLLIRCNSKSLLQIYDDFSKIIEEQKCCEVESSDFAMNVIESICHADCVISADNEVLENAILMCRYAIALRFIHELKLPWDENYVRVAENVEELENSLRKLDSYELNMKKNADFKKIIVQDSGLFNILKNDSGITLNAFLNKPSLPSVFDKLLQRISLDVVLTGFPENQSSNRYLKYLLGTNTLLGKDHCTAPVCSSASFIQWGIKTTDNNFILQQIAKQLCKDVIYIEDGLIRSVGIGLSQEPSLSIMFDDNTAYYDAVGVSHLETCLINDPEIGEDRSNYCRSCINKIVSNRVSKYNDAPLFDLNIGTSGRRKILLVDQRLGDFSISMGLGSEKSFDTMLDDALRETDCDIIIKQHPDALKGGKQSAFNKDRIDNLKKLQLNNTIITIDYCLFDIVDEVWVCTSGMGFEALMAGKKVRCYGMPFYAGWGLTEDMLSLQRRNRKHSLEHIFHYVYTVFSRYYDPDKQTLVPVEDIVDYIVSNRDKYKR